MNIIFIKYLHCFSPAAGTAFVRSGGSGSESDRVKASSTSEEQQEGFQKLLCSQDGGKLSASYTLPAQEPEGIYPLQSSFFSPLWGQEARGG